MLKQVLYLCGQFTYTFLQILQIYKLSIFTLQPCGLYSNVFAVEIHTYASRSNESHV